jgi:hypothetical protein
MKYIIRLRKNTWMMVGAGGRVISSHYKQNATRYDTKELAEHALSIIKGSKRKGFKARSLKDIKLKCPEAIIQKVKE